MAQEDSSTSSQPESLSQENMHPIELIQRYPDGKLPDTISTAPFFPVTEKVAYKPMMATPERDARSLPPVVARLVSLMTLGTMFLLPLNGCGSGESNVPCPVPTPNPAGTPVPDGTPTAACTTSAGTHYLWVHSRGGWVTSHDGIHPNQNTQGVGVDEEHNGVNKSHSGVGESHSSSGRRGSSGG